MVAASKVTHSPKATKLRFVSMEASTTSTVLRNSNPVLTLRTAASPSLNVKSLEDEYSNSQEVGAHDRLGSEGDEEG